MDKELKNTPNQVELLTEAGDHLLWTFGYEGDAYYATQYILRERPATPRKIWQLNKQSFLSKDRKQARKLWNSVIRHKKKKEK